MGRRPSVGRNGLFDPREYERRRRKTINSWLQEMKEVIEKTEPASVEEFRKNSPRLFDKLSRAGLVPEIERNIMLVFYRKKDDFELALLAYMEISEGGKQRPTSVEGLLSKDPALYLALQERGLLEAAKCPSPAELYRAKIMRENKAKKHRTQNSRSTTTSSRKDAWAEMSDEELLDKALKLMKGKGLNTLTELKSEDNGLYDFLRYKGLTKKLLDLLNQEQE